MDIKERENFNRNSTLIVEHTKEGFSDLIEFNVTLGGYNSFEKFINDKQHDIYHLCYNRSRCCQCPLGYVLPRSRILYPTQLEILLNKNGPKRPCHNPGRTADFCCCFAHQGLTTNVLDVTLARCLLVNFCQDVFLYSCLTAQTLTLEDFLTCNKHHIYHLYDINGRCCQCPPGYIFQTQRQLISKTQWHQLYSTLCLPCQQDRKRPVGGPQNICASSVTSGITVSSLGTYLSQVLIDHFFPSCPLKQSIEKLVEIRNNTFGHAKEARIPEIEYVNYRNEIESNLVFIGQICNKESIVKQKLKDLDRRTLDSVLLMQTIREQLNTREVMSTQMSEASADITSVITQHATEITTRMSEESADIRDDITSVITQNTTEITTQMSEVSADITSVITQHATEITTGMSEERAEIRNDITSAITQHAKKLEQHVQNIGKKVEDMSEALRKDPARQQIEEERKKLLETTKNKIKTHIDEKTFVHTNAVNEALDSLQQHGIVILIGPPGIGKSRIGLELLRKIDDGKCQLIQLNDISQWQDMCKDMDVLLIDDVFGRTNCSYSDDVHSKLLETIFTTVQNMDVKVILTLRNNIYQMISTNTQSQRTFRIEHVLDLSKHQMTVKEKRSCLMNYFAKNNIVETDDIKKENISDDSILDIAITVYLHEDTIQKVLYADIGTHIGFPETCYLFASHRKFTRQGHNFFCHPTESLKREIDDLRMEGDTNKRSMIDFTLLVYILLNGDSVNIDDVDKEAFISIMETMYLNPLSNIPPSYINDSADRFNGKYLTLNNVGNYCFQHRLISEAVMLSYSSADPKRVIPLLQFDFITEMTRPRNNKPSEGEVIFTVPKSCYSLLVQRLLQLLDVECSKGRYSGEPYEFVQNLCKSKIITMTGNTILQEMITQYKYNEYNNLFMELIRDHRFLGQDPYFDLFTYYFYLPAALLMFCNTDNDPLYQFLYDRIHKTLTSESGHYVMRECKKTLMWTLNFAVCTFDVKKSTVILKILTDHNIKQDYLPSEFCNKIVRCQGLPGVQLLLDLHGLSHVFNITELLSEIFRLFNSESITINDNMKQFITSVIVTNKYDKLPVRDIVEYVFRYGQLDFVKDMCERFDSSLFGVHNMIIEACRFNNTDVIQWLMEKYDGLYNVQKVLDTACSGGYTEGVKVILDRSDYSLLDMKSAMNIACSSYSLKTELLVKWLCEKFGNNLFDMKTGMNKACSSGKTELVKWLCEKFDNNLFDMKTVMNKACSSGNTELVKWLCKKFDNNLFDMKTVMNMACSSGKTELVKWLCENVDNNLFDMKTGMNEACSSFSMFKDNTELVKWLCENVDNDLFDMKTGMNGACSRGKTELVKWLCKKFDNNLFDMKTVMNMACSSGKTELVKWLCENVDNNLFDMKTGMNEACSSGKTELVK